MGLFHYLWSRTAGSNSSADANVNWSEGQAPSSVNDSARAMMASAAGFRDDISGAIVTTGTSTAYAVTSYQIFDTLAHMANMVIAFSPHTTNGATVTLNVDGLGAKPLRSSPSVELLAGTLIQGTPYVATYSALFALLSTTYGVGDGSSTFNIPDLRGRVVAGKDDMGGSAASRVTTAGGAVDGATLGATGGGQNVTLLTANLPAYTPAGTIVTTMTQNALANNTSGNATPGSTPTPTGGAATITAASAFTGTAQGGTSAVVKTLPPTIVCNYIIRII